VKNGELLVTAEGTDATVRENVEKALAGTLAVSDLDPRLVHPYIFRGKQRATTILTSSST